MVRAPPTPCTAYSVNAVKRPLRNLTSPASVEQELLNDLPAFGWSAKYEPHVFYYLVEVVYLYKPGDYLEPGQHDVLSFPSVISVGRYDTAEVSIAIGTGFADRLRLGHSIPSHAPLTETWKLQPTGLINRLTMADQQVSVRYLRYAESEGTVLGFEILTADAATPSQPLGRYNPNSETTLGVGWVGASREIALDLPPADAEHHGP